MFKGRNKAILNAERRRNSVRMLCKCGVSFTIEGYKDVKVICPSCGQEMKQITEPGKETEVLQK